MFSFYYNNAIDFYTMYELRNYHSYPSYWRTTIQFLI